MKKCPEKAERQGKSIKYNNALRALTVKGLFNNETLRGILKKMK
jgi:hypothetical protein